MSGTKAITFSVIDGSLPGGISLNAKKGLLKGKATESGTFTVRTSNSVGSAEQEFTLAMKASSKNGRP